MRSLLVLLILSGCFRAFPPAGDTADVNRHGGWAAAPLDLGDGETEETETDETETDETETEETETDETETDETETLDTAFLAELPVYDCPEPPVDALIIPLGSVNGGHDFFYDPHFACGYYFDFKGINELADDPGWLGTYVWEGNEGDWTVSLWGSMPTGCATDYQGVIPYGAEVSGSQPAFEVSLFWWDPDLCDGWWCHMGTGSATSDTNLCLSRVRPHRLSGTVTYYPADPYTIYYTIPIHFTFDFWGNGGYDADWGEGYSYFLTFYESPVTERQVFYEWCQEEPEP